MLNINEDDGWTNVTYKKPQSEKLVNKKQVEKQVKKTNKKPMVIPKWKENREWRYFTKYDYTLTIEENNKYNNLTKGICNCICCNQGSIATEILGRLVVACQRCYCCCRDDAWWCPDSWYAINRQGYVKFIGENSKLPENGERY